MKTHNPTDTSKPSNKGKLWKNYEDAVRAIINQHRRVFGVITVDPAPSKITGNSGHEWDIEITAYTSAKRKDVLVEVRRVNRNIEPAEAAELAFRVKDTRASKGYFVTPLGRRLSRGAKKIAQYHQIGHIEVSDDATAQNYILKCLNFVYGQFTEDMSDIISGIRDHLRIFLADKDGNPIRETSIDELNAMSGKGLHSSKGEVS
jgi:hypothetical protein